MRTRLTATLLVALLGSAAMAVAIDLPDITYSTATAGKVSFSHRTHLQKKKEKGPAFNCKACHVGTPKKKAPVTMAQMEKGASCGACHNGTSAFPLQKCSRCHRIGEVAFKVKETGPVRFSHEQHLKRMECGNCHDKIYRTGKNKPVGMAEMEKGKSCGACHNGKKAFSVSSCITCHPMRDRHYEVKGLSGVTFKHSVHLASYDCGGCHTGIYVPGKGNPRISMAGMEKGASCGSCHDGSTAFSVTGNCDTCHRKRTAHDGRAR